MPTMGEDMQSLTVAGAKIFVDNQYRIWYILHFLEERLWKIFN